MESKNQTGDQEEKVDYDNLDQYTKRELVNICTDLNLTVSKFSFYRFNPDRYHSESENLSLQQRHKILLKKVLKPILNQLEDFFIRNQGLTVRYMYYDNCDGQFSVQSINY